MRKEVNLSEFLDSGVNYNQFLKKIGMDNMASYPLYIYKEYFLSDKVLGLIKTKESKLYNQILKKILECDSREIKIEK